MEEVKTLTNAKMKVIGVRYIGRKPKKSADSIFPNSMLIWNGFGDCIAVPDHMAPTLLRHKDIWQHEQDPVPENQSDAALSARAAANATTALAARAAAIARRTPQQQERAYDTVPKERIITAIGDLAENPADSAKHFKPDGTPKLESVQEALGKKISQPALTEAWDELMTGGAAR